MTLATDEGVRLLGIGAGMRVGNVQCLANNNGMCLTMYGEVHLSNRSERSGCLASRAAGLANKEMKVGQ